MSGGGRTRGNGLRVLDRPFTVAAPSGARSRDRLFLSSTDEEVLRLVGRHLGQLARADLAARIRLGNVKAAGARRTERKRALTRHSSSRWAGAITRSSEDQYQLALRCLYDQQAGLRRSVRKITARLAAPCGQRLNGVRGYADEAERQSKQRRLQILGARLVEVEARISSGRPTVVVGGRQLLKQRHRLADVDLTVEEWQERWDAARLFLTADGESGAPHGNYTVTADPDCGAVAIALPEPLRHLANAPCGRYRLSCTVTFHHRREEWLDRITANKAVRYDIVHDPHRDRWYLDASWSATPVRPPAPEDLARAGARLLGVDINADHLAACVVDAHGNPVGQPFTLSTDLSGPASRRDGQLRAAITELLTVAVEHGCSGVAIENLDFAEARAIGRETMGRGRRGKRFRRTVAGMPTAKFRERLRGIAHHRGLIVVAVDPAYTSRWGGRHWQNPLQQQARITVTRHHCASLAIGRRALGHGLRRRPDVTRRRPEDRLGRATGQAVPRPGAPGTADPPRMPGTPHTGGKTRVHRRDQLALSLPFKTVRKAAGSGRFEAI